VSKPVGDQGRDLSVAVAVGDPRSGDPQHCGVVLSGLVVMRGARTVAEFVVTFCKTYPLICTAVSEGISVVFSSSKGGEQPAK